MIGNVATAARVSALTAVSALSRKHIISLASQRGVGPPKNCCISRRSVASTCSYSKIGAVVLQLPRNPAFTRLIKKRGLLTIANGITDVSMSSSSNYSIIERGTPNSTSYSVYFQNESHPISPMHDIPLYADQNNKIFNMVVEVPRWTNAKMEINLAEPLNPIKQDVKKGNLRFVANCFPHHGYIWNYGALPQTWEDPEILDAATGSKGDGDPIDVLEIGYRVAKRGEVLQVKVLGIVALIDEGETDWKIIVIDVNDPLASRMNDVSDINEHYPGLLKATIEWFKIYKIPDGKPENQFAFNGEAKPKDFALNVIEEVHQHWQSLIKKGTTASTLSCVNTMVADSPFKVEPSAAQEIVDKAPVPEQSLPIDSSVDKWHYINLQ